MSVGPWSVAGGAATRGNDLHVVKRDDKSDRHGEAAEEEHHQQDDWVRALRRPRQLALRRGRTLRFELIHPRARSVELDLRLRERRLQLVHVAAQAIQLFAKLGLLAPMALLGYLALPAKASQLTLRLGATCALALQLFHVGAQAFQLSVKLGLLAPMAFLDYLALPVSALQIGKLGARLR